MPIFCAPNLKSPHPALVPSVFTKAEAFSLPQASSSFGKHIGLADSKAQRMTSNLGNTYCESVEEWATDELDQGSDQLLAEVELPTTQSREDENLSTSFPTGTTTSVTEVLGATEEFSLYDELASKTDSGIFEVLLPDGESLGVAVDVRAAGIGFLLSPASDKLRTRLQNQQMELEDVLKRHMGRSVKIAIL